MENERPKVAIVGAGLGGLTLGILLGKAGIEYDIYERAREVKPLGSAIGFGALLAPAWKQIGIWDEYTSLAKHVAEIDVFNGKREPVFTASYVDQIPMGGAKWYVIARPLLYDLLLRQVPRERIHMNKRVLSMNQNENGILIRTSDNQTHEADILVGADGAHSAVRQGLYGWLKKNGSVPSSDTAPLPYSCICLVGQTGVLDAEKFPDVLSENSHFNNMLGDELPYSWATFTTKQNTICWMVIQYLDKVSSKENDSFRNSEWGPEAAEAMCKDVHDLQIPGGKNGVELTIGDLIDETPKEFISKVMLEEKVFETWYGGRTVLMGDACHKVNPSGGQGAVNAMHDAICLANWINVLPSTQEKDIENIFKEYTKERKPLAQASLDASLAYARVSAKTTYAKVMRYISKNLPPWLWRIMLSKMVENRPQVSFLPPAEDMGTTKAQMQPSYQKTKAIMAKAAKKAAAATV